MAKPKPTELEVVQTSRISEHMVRVTLGGSGLNTFPQDQESAYIKLIFPAVGGGGPHLRTYSIRNQRADGIDIDVTLHETMGLASTWALNAGAGDRILVGGPGPRKLINHDADWYLLVGDMTALPSISVNLAKLPSEARGYALIEVMSEDDIQTIEHPTGVTVRWLVNPHPGGEGSAFLSAVEALPWLKGRAAVWAACEFNGMKVLRRYFRKVRNVPLSHLYLSSYWKLGQAEEGHKAAKREDSESEEALV